MRTKKSKSIIFFLLIVIIFGLIGYFSVIRPIQKIKVKVASLKTEASGLKQVFLENNIDLLNKKYKDLSSKYGELENEAKAMYWISYIPFIGAYGKDVKNGVEAGRYFIDAGQMTIEAITPYADLIGFKKGTSSFGDKSAEDRLQTAVLTLDKVLGKIDGISEKIDQAQTRINSINPQRYPEKIGKTQVRSQLVNLKEQIMGVSSLFVDAKPLLKKIPQIFGKDREQVYLILFQNDKELRATGGFLTSYALFRVEKGKIRIERSEDIYSLDESIKSHPAAPKEILTYHKDVSKFYIRDSNLSPDLVESIKIFNTLYNKSTRKFDYDGIITIDSNVLVDMLTIFGDTEADGILFSSKKDPKCDCPQVLYRLFDLVDRPTGYIRTNRKGILGDLMYALFYKAIGFSPTKYWGTLTQEMFKDLREKHILLYFKDPQVQESVEKLNYAGRIRNFDGDYVHINDVNFAGAKSNMFVSHEITSKTTINNDGKVSRELAIVYKNPYPHSDCSLERGGLCLNAILRNWIRIYVPKGSTLVDFKGSEKKVNTYDELGKTVFEGFLTVSPEGRAEVVVEYNLPDGVVKNKGYQVLFQKQPGTSDYKLQAQLNGKTIYNGLLNEDQVIKGN